MNRARCKNCLDLLHSKHRHDFVTCSCFTNTSANPGIAIDGGDDYIRRLGEPENFIEVPDEGETMVIEIIADKETTLGILHQIAMDSEGIGFNHSSLLIESLWETFGIETEQLAVEV